MVRNNLSLVDNDFYTPEILKALKDFRTSFIGQAIMQKIDFQLDKLMKRFDSGRISETYQDRASFIQGARKELIQLRSWMLQQ